MQLLLKEDVEYLGHRGEVVAVAPGYARNYLIPRDLGVEGNPGNVKMVEAEKRKIAVKEEKRKDELGALKRRLEGVRFIIKARVSEEGHLYGSVGDGEIVSSVRDTIGVEVEPRM